MNRLHSGAIVLSVVFCTTNIEASVTGTVNILRNGQSHPYHVIDEGELVDFEYTWNLSIDNPVPSERFITTTPSNTFGTLLLPNGSTSSVIPQNGVSEFTDTNPFSFRPDDDGDYVARISGQVGVERGFDEFLGDFGYSDTSNSIIRVQNVAPVFREEFPDLQIPFGLVFGLWFTAYDPSPVDQITFVWDYENDGNPDQTDIATIPEERFSSTPQILHLPSTGELVVSVSVSDDDGGKNAKTIRFTAFEGDYNGDGVVDAADYSVWRNSYGLEGDGLYADGNRDGVVNDIDYGLWRKNYGNVFSLGSSITAVPEPSAVSICLAGIVWFGGRRIF